MSEKNLDARLAAALSSISTATGVRRSRSYDAARATRNGHAARDARLEEVVIELEAAAEKLWSVVDAPLS